MARRLAPAGAPLNPGIANRLQNTPPNYTRVSTDAGSNDCDQDGVPCLCKAAFEFALGPHWSRSVYRWVRSVESRRTLRTAACGARPFATTPARTDTPPQLAPSRSSPPPTGFE